MTQSRLRKTLTNFTGLAIMAIAIWSFWKLLFLLWNVFSKINPTVGAGMVAASATVIVSIISVLVSKSIERKSQLLSEMRSKKTPIYEDMVKFIFRINFSAQLGQPPVEEKEMVEKLAWFTENFVIWGSDDLNKAWLKFRMSSIEGTNSGMDVLFQVEELLLAIRKDLGHKNEGFKRGTILGLFINDIQNHLTP